MASYEIGGVAVEMTASQAERWNGGCPSQRDLNSIRCGVPTYQNQARHMTLRRATNKRLEPVIAELMLDSPANRCG